MMLLNVLQRIGLLLKPEPEPRRLNQWRLIEAIRVLEQFPEDRLIDVDPISILRAHWQTWDYGVGKIIGGDKSWTFHHIELPYQDGEYGKGWTPGIGRDRVVAHLKTLLTDEKK